MSKFIGFVSSGEVIIEVEATTLIMPSLEKSQELCGKCFQHSMRKTSKKIQVALLVQVKPRRHRA